MEWLLRGKERNEPNKIDPLPFSSKYFQVRRTRVLERERERHETTNPVVYN